MQTSTHNISFLSYNLYCLPWIATLFHPSSCPLPTERSSHFATNHLNSFDILALQEVWHPRYSIVEKHAKKNNLHVVGSSAPSPFRYYRLRFFGGGLMIISKHPIVERREIVFEKGNHSDGFVTKGVLYAKIQVGSSFIHVFNTHLQASYGWEFDYDNNPWVAIRTSQLTELMAFVNKVTHEDTHHYPVIVMGDFNVNARNNPGDGSDSREYTEMIEMMSQEGKYEVKDVLKGFHNGEHPITYGGQGVCGPHGVGEQRLDFVFELTKKASSHRRHKPKFTKGEVVHFEVQGNEFTHVSDHFGVTASMELHITDHEQEEVDDGASQRLDGLSITLSSSR